MLINQAHKACFEWLCVTCTCNMGVCVCVDVCSALYCVCVWFVYCFIRAWLCVYVSVYVCVYYTGVIIVALFPGDILFLYFL